MKYAQPSTSCYDEVRLWRSVIERAVMDALGSIPDVPRFVNRNQELVLVSRWRQIKDEARQWLMNDPEFNVVCDLAELEPTRVRRHFSRLLSRDV